MTSLDIPGRRWATTSNHASMALDRASHRSRDFVDVGIKDEVSRVHRGGDTCTDEQNLLTDVGQPQNTCGTTIYWYLVSGAWYITRCDMFMNNATYEVPDILLYRHAVTAHALAATVAGYSCGFTFNSGTQQIDGTAPVQVVLHCSSSGSCSLD